VREREAAFVDFYVALSVQADSIGSLEGDSDAAWVGMWRDDKVVLGGATVSIKDVSAT